MLVVEALVALVEHSLQCEATTVTSAFKLVLHSIGAGPDTSRSAVADVLAESAAASIVRRFACIPTDVRPEAVLEELAAWVGLAGAASGPDDPRFVPGGPRWPAASGSGSAAGMMGFGMSKVVPLDALVALVALVGAGSLEERVGAAFWTLDRDGAEYLTLDQLLRFSGLLVAVAAAGRLVLGLPRLQRGNAGATAAVGGAASSGDRGPPPPVAAADGSSLLATAPAGSRAQSFTAAGGSPGSSTSRSLIEAALRGAFAEHCLQAEGPGGLQARLTVERLASVVQSAVEHITMAVVQHATAAATWLPDGTSASTSTHPLHHSHQQPQAHLHNNHHHHNHNHHLHQQHHLGGPSHLAAAGSSFLARQGPSSAPVRPCPSPLNPAAAAAAAAAAAVHQRHGHGANASAHHHYHHNHHHNHRRSNSNSHSDSQGQLPRHPSHPSQDGLAAAGSSDWGPLAQQQQHHHHRRQPSRPSNGGDVTAPQHQAAALGLSASATTRERTTTGVESPGMQAFGGAAAGAGGQGPLPHAISASVGAVAPTPALSMQPPRTSPPSAPTFSTLAWAAAWSPWAWGSQPSSAPSPAATTAAPAAAGVAAAGKDGQSPQLPPPPPPQLCCVPPSQLPQSSQQRQGPLERAGSNALQRGIFWSITTSIGQTLFGYGGRSSALASGPEAQGAGALAGGGGGGGGAGSGAGDGQGGSAPAGGLPGGEDAPVRQAPALGASPSVAIFVDDWSFAAGSSSCVPPPPQLHPQPVPLPTTGIGRQLDRVNEHPEATTSSSPEQTPVRAPPRPTYASVSAPTPSSVGSNRPALGAPSPLGACTAASSGAAAADAANAFTAVEEGRAGIAGGRDEAFGREEAPSRTPTPQKEIYADEQSSTLLKAKPSDVGGASIPGTVGGLVLDGTPAESAGVGGTAGDVAATQSGNRAAGAASSAASGSAAATSAVVSGGAGGGGSHAHTPRHLHGLRGLTRWRRASGATHHSGQNSGDPGASSGGASSLPQHGHAHHSAAGGGGVGANGGPTDTLAAGAGMGREGLPLPHHLHYPHLDDGFSAAGTSSGRRSTPLLQLYRPSVGIVLDAAPGAPGGGTLPSLLPSNGVPSLHTTSARASHFLEEAASRAEVAARAEAAAAATRGGAAASAATGGAAGGGGREAAAPVPGGHGAGGGGGPGGTVLPPLQRAIKSSVQRAGVRLFLHCGVCLLSIIALLLMDAALVAWVYLDRRQRLSLSLVIVAATNGGLVLLVLVISIVRSCMADRAAALEAAAAARRASGGAGGGGGGVPEFLINNFLTPALRTLGVMRGPDDGSAAGPGAGSGGAGSQGAGDQGGGWGSRLRVLWATIGRVAGFDSMPAADSSHGGGGRGELRTSRSDNLDQMSYGYNLRSNRPSDVEASGPGGLSPIGGLVAAHARGGTRPSLDGDGGARTSGHYVRGYTADAHLLSIHGSSAAKLSGRGLLGSAAAPAPGSSGYSMLDPGGGMAGMEAMGAGPGGSGHARVGAEGGGMGLTIDPRDTARAAGAAARQRTRGTALPGPYYAKVPSMQRVELAYPAL